MHGYGTKHWWWGNVGAALAVVGCMGKPGALTAFTDPATAVGIINAAPDNAILAVGGTIQLGVTAQSLTGTPLTTFDSVVYRRATASDSVRVGVSATGLVTGLTPTSAPAPINVLVFRSGTWSGDQVLITVTPTAVAGLTLSIQPPPGDSTKLARGTAKTIVPVLRNPTTGQGLTGIQLQYAVLPSEEANVGVFRGAVAFSTIAGAVSLHRSLSSVKFNQIIPYVATGAAWIYANISAYGTLLQDSVRYTWSYPYTGTILISKSNLAVLTALNSGAAIGASINPDLTIAPGGTVTFTNGVAGGDLLTLAFTFDNPGAATVAVPPANAGGTAGNVTTLTAGQSSTRQFLTAGTYHWTWIASGGPAPWAGQTATGAIVVK